MARGEVARVVVMIQHGAKIFVAVATPIRIEPGTGIDLTGRRTDHGPVAGADRDIQAAIGGKAVHGCSPL